jgi:hypothetical protein
MKHIALALHNYHDDHGAFPPASIVDDDGRPMHSWRVLILPYFEYQPLYTAYNLDEPWNGPNNRKLLSKIPEAYQCPSHHRSHGQFDTCYIAVTGKSTMWQDDRRTMSSDITDGLNMTVMLVEHHGLDIRWMEPRDLKFEQVSKQFGQNEDAQEGPHSIESFFYRNSAGRHVVLADGSVRFISDGVPTKSWNTVLTAAGGEKQSEHMAFFSRYFKRKLRVGVCIRLGIWIALVVFPLPWVWCCPNRDTTMHI